MEDPENFRTNVKMVFIELCNNNNQGDNIERSIYNCILQDADEKNIIKLKVKKCDHENLKKRIERSNHGQKRMRVNNSGKIHWRV